MTNEERFFAWLEDNHPGTYLTTMQDLWLRHQLRGEATVWAGGRATGHSFAFDLLREFYEEIGANLSPSASLRTPNPGPGTPNPYIGRSGSQDRSLGGASRGRR